MYFSYCASRATSVDPTVGEVRIGSGTLRRDVHFI